MTVMRYFARNSLTRLAAFGVSAVAAFVVTPHMLDCLGKSAYGVLALITSLAGCWLLLDVGIFQAVANLSPGAAARGDTTRENAIFSTGCCLSAVSCVLTLIIGAVLALSVGRLTEAAQSEEAAGTALFLYSASVAVQLLCRASHGLLAARMRWSLLACLSMLRTLATSAAVLLLLSPRHSGGMNLLLAAGITSGGNTLESLTHCILALRTVSFRPGLVSLGRAKEILRYGLPVLIIQIGDLLKLRTQIYIVASLLGLAQVTLFSLAGQFINYMYSIMLNAFGIMGPYFSRMKAEGNAAGCREPLLHCLGLSYAVSSYIGLCLALYGGLFLERWLGAGFSAVQEALIPMALGGAAAFGAFPAEGLLFGLGRPRILAGNNIACGLLLLTASVPAAWLYGLPGVGWVMFAASCLFNLVVLPAQVCRVSGLRPRAYAAVVFGTLAAQCAAQLGCYAAIRGMLVPSYPALFLAVCGQGAAAAVAFFLCRKVSGTPAGLFHRVEHAAEETPAGASEASRSAGGPTP